MKSPILSCINKAVVFCVSLLSIARAQIGVISPEDAFKLISSNNPPVVIDTRGGYKDYFRGHIPGAQHMNFDTLRGTDAGIPVQYLPSDLTGPLLVRAGASEGKIHLVYATGSQLPNDEILSATMVAYVLEKYGISDIRIIDGGLAGWKAAGLSETKDYFANSRGNLPQHREPEVAVSADQVIEKKDDKGVVLVDARPLNEFQGKDDVWLRKGHIPGAISFHWARLMDKENTHKFRPFDEVKAELVAAGITPEKEILCYCGTSREGSLVRFYLKHVANYPNVKLYEGAWKEYIWINGKKLPAEEGGEAAGLR